MSTALLVLADQPIYTWRREHYHCPNECEHPQPFRHTDGRVLCGICFFWRRTETEVFLCTPETCPEDG
jgi:hypothetical protein